jgi:hypothetical protein
MVIRKNELGGLKFCGECDLSSARESITSTSPSSTLVICHVPVPPHNNE